jgi:hypothetical protein
MYEGRGQNIMEAWSTSELASNNRYCHPADVVFVTKLMFYLMLFVHASFFAELPIHALP